MFNIKKIVKKTTALLSAVIISFGIIPISVTQSATKIGAITVKHDGISHNYITYQNGNTLKFPIITTSNGKYGYCLEHTKGTPQNIQATKTGELDNGISYILKNGLHTQGQTQKSRYMIGNDTYDYYITQTAMKLYLGASGGGIDDTLKNSPNDERILNNARALAIDARNNKSAKASINASITPSSQTFYVSGEYFKTDNFTVNVSGEYTDYQVLMQGASSSVEVVNGNTNQVITNQKIPANTPFYLRVSKANATQDLNINIGIRVWYSKEVSNAFTPSDPTKQKITILEKEPTQDELRDRATANLKAIGSAKIIKTSEDGKVDGINFTIQGNGINKTVTTANGGQIQIDNLKPGIYTVTEQSYNQYNPQEIKRVTVLAGQTAVVNFNNTLKRGDLKVTKTSEDGLNEGVKFSLKGTSISGLPVNEFAITDSSGVAVFKDVLIGENYVLSEVDTPNRYVIPKDQTATVEWNKVTNKEFENILKKWRAIVTKSDKETGTPQGNSSLAGAVYGIYKGEQLIDKYTTDENGQFITKYYVCSDDWTVREISASEGYLVDDTIYKVGAEPQNYEIELNDTSLDVLETIKKGKIAIIKHADDGSTQIETPEVGAEFEIYLKSSGSFENAKESERDKLITDNQGFAQTKDLPYGEYTVRQTKGLEGTELMPPFDVNITENNKVYFYLINNAIFKSLVEIVKKDAETGEIIKASGIGFKVRNTDTGEWITQHINYPTPMDIDVFYTDQNGKLMLPQALYYGNYEIVEQCTANGYVLDITPVPFKVDGTQTEITVEKYNKPQKGKIIVSKIGEVFSSVEETDGMYKPVYLENNLKGAEFKIYADEDITTLDGTIRNKKGDLVSTIITNEQGKAETSPLYLGKYKIIETKVPTGMIKNTAPQYVELTYAGQEIEITQNSTKIYNQRQKVEINLEKILEQDEEFSIGTNNEILSVNFGLFANEAIVATDGNKIPKDGLIEVVSCDENGKAIFKTDIPFGKYYVKEIATDEHYVVDDTKYEFEFNYQGEDIDIVKIDINNGEAIENKLIRGEILGKKVDEEGFTIAGATFGLFKDNETEFIKDTAIRTSKSNEIGVFGFSDVPYGKYLVRELETVNGFVLNETPYKVQVKDEKQVVEIEIENKFIKGEVTTTKLDAETKEKLSGAVFEIYVDVDNNKEFDSKIDKLLSEMTEKEKGVYKLDNLKYGGYFMYEKTAPEGFIKDDKYYYFNITNNEETVVVENETGVGFTNKPIPKEPPKTELPKTSDNSSLGFFIGLLGIAVGGIIALVIIYIKNKKDDNK